MEKIHFPTQRSARAADEVDGETDDMIISVTISDAVIRAAQERGQTVVEYVEGLIDKGMATSTARPTVSDALDRIRALRTSPMDAKR